MRTPARVEERVDGIGVVDQWMRGVVQSRIVLGNEGQVEFGLASDEYHETG